MTELFKSIVIDGERVVVEMTNSEIAQYEKDQAEAAEIAIKAAEATARRQALLDKLGITDDEAKLLLS